jgi:hypothetical protein
MKCDQVLSVLSRFQDGECDEKESLSILSHLDTCSRCHEELNRMDQLLKVMNGMDEVEPVSNFTSKTMGRLNDFRSSSRIPIPSLLYSFVFGVFFLLGLILSQTLETEKINEKRELTVVQILMESQNLNQFYAQNKTINWLQKDDTNEK